MDDHNQTVAWNAFMAAVILGGVLFLSGCVMGLNYLWCLFAWCVEGA